MTEYRDRDIFPLPELVVDDAPHGASLSRSVKKRTHRRVHVQKQVNNSVAALNSLFFGGGSSSKVEPVRDLKELSHSAQRDSLSHILSRVQAAGAPSERMSHSEALQALRVTSSPYGDAMSGVGEVVSMSLEALSVPDMGVQGVPIQDLLQGAAGEYLKDPESNMLQDASNWGAICDEISKMKIYNDPKMKSRGFYLRFLKKLHRAGILSFSLQPLGRVGAFAVKKKPKEVDGTFVDRHRLILDCRQVNLLFRAPPSTELGSLPAVGDIYIPEGENLHVAGADIKDCFYACRLPPTLRDYFCFYGDITLSEAQQIYDPKELSELDGSGGNVSISPCLDVLPMGYSWSFYLVQALHVQACLKSSGEAKESVVLDSRPPPILGCNTTVSMPYCDNTHVLSINPEAAMEGHNKLQGTLEEWGFSMHEEMGPTTQYPTLGGVIDGSAGLVKPNHNRYWRLLRAFNYVCYHPVSSEMIMRLLGHAMVVLVLNRMGMSVFRSLYDFSSKGFKRKMLWDSAIRECRNFMGILPLLVADMRTKWSTHVFCSDASPEGYGITERVLDSSEVERIGAWQERWRYKRSPIEQWRPRERALRLDPFHDIATARVGEGLCEEGDRYTRNEEFEEIPHHILQPEDWKVSLSGKWKHTSEHITLKEARALTILVRRLSRASKFRNKRILILVDNLALALSVGKGRSCNHAMLRVAQKIGAIALACNFCLRVRWIPSELNVSDGPSRGSNSPGYGQPAGPKSETTIGGHSRLSGAQEVSKKHAISQGADRGLEDHGNSEERQERVVEKASGGKAKVCCGGFTNARRQPQEERWKSGQTGVNVHFGDPQHQQRAAEPVWALPREIQGLVQGERHQVAGRSSNGCDPRRLLRRSNLDGKGSHEGEKTLAAVEFHHHKLKGKLNRSRRALRGWRKLVPQKSRLPLPRLVAYGIAMRLIFLQKLDMALMVLLSFDAYLRPGEAIGLLGKNLVAPVAKAGRQYRHYTVIVKDEDECQPDKTGTFNNSIVLDNPLTSPWLGPALMRLKKKNGKENPLFNIKMEQYRDAFQKAGSWLGLPGLHTYQLRHGGASEDLASKTREYNMVKDRGRWRTDTSVRRYAKIGKLQNLMSEMPSWALHYCRTAVTQMPQVVAGQSAPIHM